MRKKYKTKLDPETGLLRIIALKNFSDVKKGDKGDKGGLIEKEENLSKEGNCWIYDNARVYGEAIVFGDACVSGNARISGRTYVYCHAKISGNVKLYSTKVSWITTSIKDSKDYVILGHIFSLSNNTEEDASIVEEDYLKNIQTIRQLYRKEI